MAAAPAQGDPPLRILNVNVGIMGHVDSGKTSLARALSTLLSTAALDKSPASQERGITLDLGFSAFLVDMPAHLSSLPYDKLQFTLVDCPGHASLIRTIIGGSHIIDMMMLVVDITKGIQTQTAECIVIGEITCNNSIVVLNKIDKLPLESRAQQIEKMKLRLKKTFENTRFRDAPMVAVAAGAGEQGGQPSENLAELITTLCNVVREPARSRDGLLLFEFDHCFQIKNQGTVLTGTMLRGSVKINQTIEFPSLKEQRKVKSMQMFHRPVSQAMQGDRVGICVTQLDPKLLERGIVCEPGSVMTLSAAIVSAIRVRFFKGEIKTKAQFHVTVGHVTVMASIQFFSTPAVGEDTKVEEAQVFNSRADYIFRDSLPSPTDADYVPAAYFALLTFEKPIIAPLDSVVIASKLDSDININTCRIAFHGRLIEPVDNTSPQTLHEKLRIYKTKTKQGQIERIYDKYTLIGKDLFKKETNMNLFVNMKVTKENGEVGVIESSFGNSGKFKVRFDKEQTEASGPLYLSLRRYIFDPKKKNYQ